MNDQRFTFLCTKGERIQLANLADHYHRSQSDTIRMLIREAIQVMVINSETSKKVHKKNTSGEEIHEKPL